MKNTTRQKTDALRSRLKPLDKVLLEVPDVAAVCSLGVDEIQARIRSGELRAVHLGRRVLVHRDDLELWARGLAGETAA